MSVKEVAHLTDFLDISSSHVWQEAASYSRKVFNGHCPRKIKDLHQFLPSNFRNIWCFFIRSMAKGFASTWHLRKVLQLNLPQIAPVNCFSHSIEVTIYTSFMTSAVVTLVFALMAIIYYQLRRLYTIKIKKLQYSRRKSPLWSKRSLLSICVSPDVYHVSLNFCTSFSNTTFFMS